MTWYGKPGQAAHCRVDVDGGEQSVDRLPGRRNTGVTHQERHATRFLPWQPFSSEPVRAHHVAMIRRVHDDGVVRLSGLIQLGQKPAKLRVDGTDVSVVSLLGAP